MNSQKLSSPIVRLTFSAMMIALSTVLSNVRLFRMPSGGSITLFSMLPIIIIAFIYGIKWGCFTGFVHGVFQILFGMDSLRGMTLLIVVGSVILDFLLAYGVLGLASIFKNKIKNQVASFTLGTAFVCVLRFLCHFVSGFLLYGDLSGDAIGSIIYSLTYNISYMGPEIVFTVAGAAVFAGTFSLADLIKNKSA